MSALQKKVHLASTSPLLILVSSRERTIGKSV